MNLSKTILLTGACGGLGSVIAEKLATAGYQLALHVKEEDERSVELASHLGKASYRFFSADLEKEEEIIEMVKAIEAHFGSLYAVINNAGIAYSGMSWKQSAEDWDRVFNSNTKAPWLVSKHALPLLRKSNTGRIIYISSIVAHRPLAGTSAYAASKSALEGLTRAQAVELSKFNITVNCIAPGYFNAGMIDAVSDIQQSEIAKATPAARLGKAEELAAHISYLCSDEAAFINGQIHHINGGLYI